MCNAERRGRPRREKPNMKPIFVRVHPRCKASCQLLLLGWMLFFGLHGLVQAQPVGSRDSAQPPNDGGVGRQAQRINSAGQPEAADDDDNSSLLWIIAGVAVFVVLGGGLVVVVLMRKSGTSKGPQESIVPDSGKVLNGYRFKSHLMTGQTSQVWEVVEANSGRHFAMKILLPQKSSDRESRTMLFHEADVGRKIAHTNIIKIMNVDRSMHNPHFVMEFFPSGSLRLKLKQADFIREQASSILKQAATGLAYMNAYGWVHRDIKPDNILVNAAGEVRIIDFALAQRIPKGFFEKKFKKRKCQGTRSYMSPEQILCKPLDGRADVYSFGATAYELVTGRPPFRGADSRDLLQKHLSDKPVAPQVLNPDVTKEFSDLVLRMLAKKKEERPKDFHEVLMKLKTIKVFKSQTTQPSAK
jgi:eukaryotic-like serine/threonine-protein kinase